MTDVHITREEHGRHGRYVATVGGTPEAGIMSLRPGGIWAQILPGAYVFVWLAVLVGTAVWLLRRCDDVGLTRPPTQDLEHLEGVDTGRN